MLSRPDDGFEKAIVGEIRMLRACAMKLCRNKNDADDLVQETMMRAIENRSSYTSGTNIGAWLVTIQRNFYLSLKRKYSRELPDPDCTFANSIPIEDSPVKKMEAAEALALVGKLPRQFGDALRMIADGASYEDVATEMHEHVGTIKSRVNRAREMLRAAK